jgi:F420-non-reducing hydrogenase iron-sulfur subunit
MTIQIEKDNIDGDFEPEILMFACNWCSYSGIDLAGTSRMEYPTNVTVIRTMCSGRVDPSFVMEAFNRGLDGVIISTCHGGDCHYIDGNYKTNRRVKLLQQTLEDFGIDQRRLKLTPISASEGRKATEVVKQMVDDIRILGPFYKKEV